MRPLYLSDALVAGTARQVLHLLGVAATQLFHLDNRLVRFLQYAPEDTLRLLMGGQRSPEPIICSTDASNLS